MGTGPAAAEAGAGAAGAGAAAGGAGPGGEEAAPPPQRIFLEAALEEVSPAPFEFNRLMSTMRDIDYRTSGLQQSAEEIKDKLLSLAPASARNATEKQKQEVADLKEDLKNKHETLVQLAGEKIQLAKRACDLVDGHIYYMDKEILKFEDELGAETLLQAELAERNVTLGLDELPSPTEVRPLMPAHRKATTIRSGSQVAAKISPAGAPDEWILARVTKVSDDGSTFTVLDEDAEEGGGSHTHLLKSSSIIGLPKGGVNVGGPKHNTGDAVLAVYPQSTVFYRAYVVEPAKWQTPESTYTNYILTFDDDHDEAGYPPPRPVPFVHVVPLPKNFIPTGF